MYKSLQFSHIVMAFTTKLFNSHRTDLRPYHFGFITKGSAESDHKLDQVITLKLEGCNLY